MFLVIQCSPMFCSDLMTLLGVYIDDIVSISFYHCADIILSLCRYHFIILYDYCFLSRYFTFIGFTLVPKTWISTTNVNNSFCGNIVKDYDIVHRYLPYGTNNVLHSHKIINMANLCQINDVLHWWRLRLPQFFVIAYSNDCSFKKIFYIQVGCT